MAHDSQRNYDKIVDEYNGQKSTEDIAIFHILRLSWMSLIARHLLRTANTQGLTLSVVHTCSVQHQNSVQAPPKNLEEINGCG